MVLPTIPTAITMTQIRNEFSGAGTPNPTTYSSLDSDLYNLNYYRGKYFWNGNTGNYETFPTGAISISDFSGKAANCTSDCVCICGDGGDGG